MFGSIIRNRLRPIISALNKLPVMNEIKDLDSIKSIKIEVQGTQRGVIRDISGKCTIGELEELQKAIEAETGPIKELVQKASG